MIQPPPRVPSRQTAPAMARCLGWLQRSENLPKLQHKRFSVSRLAVRSESDTHMLANVLAPTLTDPEAAFM